MRGGTSTCRGETIAAGLADLTARLLVSQRSGAPLADLLHQADRLAEETRHYAAAAVHEARSSGDDWDVIAASAGVSEASARGRWSERKLNRILAGYRARTPSAPRLPPGAREASAP
ncbi:hypothetical protein B1H18_12935 [Streptomyces tsukubensis]|uniref:Uncharacterized protein n=1 Tax=Streptomyces tsukubensis TaxID=83656 RepID=A0A1V4A9A5_9ACTN|nr:hypothetical protein B1H18_12935 [Streptomyces tsukubensis]